MPSILSRSLCGALCLALAFPAHAVTGARAIVDFHSTGGNTTYMASVNDTGQPIVHLGTEYFGLAPSPDLIIDTIPPHYTPSNTGDTAYTRAHPLYQQVGLGFDQMFPNGVSGGYRYPVSCGSGSMAQPCHLPADGHAVTRYQTTCNGRPLRFKVTAAWKKEPGTLLATSLTSIGGTTLSRPLLQLLVVAYEMVSNLALTSGTSGPITMGELVASADASWWIANPLNQAARASLVRAGPYVGLLAAVVYFEIATRLAPHGALFSQDSTIEFSADGDSRITQTIADTPLEQHLIIDDCLEIDAITQDLPYAQKGDTRLVPDVNDALVTTVFRHRLPDISAKRSCSLIVDDSGTQYSGTCIDAIGRSVPATLDASGCTNSTDIVNDNGRLACVGERVSQPKGSYLQSCRYIRWDGSTLHASCGGFDFSSFPTLQYARDCQPGSTVSYERSAKALRCDIARSPS